MSYLSLNLLASQLNQCSSRQVQGKLKKSISCARIKFAYQVQQMTPTGDIEKENDEIAGNHTRVASIIDLTSRKTLELHNI